MDNDRACYLCACPGDLRPYGPKGEWTCFSCAMATPERKRETERQFATQLAAVNGPVVIGEEVGPYPADHDPRFQSMMKEANK